ncbi:hypothetical protein K458DRAFT_460607 [Lentithecium fluviatile CBS 122367]|uniref:Uncharacterized protein n=1 Tax=Lentithecium fluviatile CBS 122367 TaxID=1168545 RepID=A0A6G1INN1_9PLEO|nr:hypothetical protein K458DRAFT_460607 [Lentithecium fluviatile CBS 122367]
MKDVGVGNDVGVVEGVGVDTVDDPDAAARDGEDVAAVEVVGWVVGESNRGMGSRLGNPVVSSAVHIAVSSVVDTAVASGTLSKTVSMVIPGSPPRFAIVSVIGTIYARGRDVYLFCATNVVVTARSRAGITMCMLIDVAGAFYCLGSMSRVCPHDNANLLPSGVPDMQYPSSFGLLNLVACSRTVQTVLNDQPQPDRWSAQHPLLANPKSPKITDFNPHPSNHCNASHSRSGDEKSLFAR